MTPSNRNLVRTFGIVLLAGVLLSLRTGVTYYRGTIRHSEAPFSFWATVVSYVALGGFLVIGSFVAD